MIIIGALPDVILVEESRVALVVVASDGEEILIIRIVIALLLSIVVTIILFVLAAMSDGMCHCMKSMFTLFPYGTWVTMRTNAENFGLVLVFIQFPLYATVLTIVRTIRWKALALVVIVAIHAEAATLALRPYNSSRYPYTTSSIR
jgi:hypothetical protein